MTPSPPRLPALLLPALLLAALLAAPLPPPADAQSATPQSAPPPAATPAPAPAPRAPDVLLPADRLVPDPVTGRLVLPPGALPPPPADLPAVAPADMSPEAALLRRLIARGVAGGLAGVLYDNRDRGHSALPPEAFPQLMRIVYPPVLVARGLDHGLAGRFRFPAPVLGNSSTAITAGPEWRSQTRAAMTLPGGPARAAADHDANALYIYPEHRDHDDVDLFPAAWPYTLTTQGSSHSDRPFLRAAALILAALPADTRARATEEGLIVPTVQMVLRRAQTGVRTRADYLSGAAHPSAFDARALAPAAMVSLAASLTPDTLPPAVRLTVLEEDFAPRAGLTGQSERLFDTPSAIARLWRGPAHGRTITLSAAATRDPNGRALRFHWVVLRGDPAAVTVTPLDEAGVRARIGIAWQEPRPAPRAPALNPGPSADAPAPPLSSRVDIGVFADNGVHLSAPAFLSVAFPAHERRRYAPGPDGVPRLAEADYDAVGRGAAFDPVLWWSAPWTDLFDETGGFTRIPTRPEGAPAAATHAADGTRRDGRPFRYVLRSPRGRAEVPELAVELAEGPGG